MVCFDGNQSPLNVSAGTLCWLPLKICSAFLQSSGRRHIPSRAPHDPWVFSVKEEEACLISRPLVAKFSSAESRSFDRGLMSKDGRHDGRRRGAAQQHRFGMRASQSGDGRDRSASNSSGSSHGGGKGRNTPINIALKVTNNGWLKTHWPAAYIDNISVFWTRWTRMWSTNCCLGRQLSVTMVTILSHQNSIVATIQNCSKILMTAVIQVIYLLVLYY